MLYAVTAEAIDLNSPPDVILMIVEQQVIPSLQMLDQLEKAGKIKGGVWSGYRGGTMIVNAATNEEVNEILIGLPFWGIHRWDVTPLHSWSAEVKSATGLAQNLRKQLGK